MQLYKTKDKAIRFYSLLFFFTLFLSSPMSLFAQSDDENFTPLDWDIEFDKCKGELKIKFNVIEYEGDDTHCPFVDHDPAKPLDEDVLDQWDGWLTLMERHGINVHLEFYNDATDVESMGWKLAPDGNLPADEARWIAGNVERDRRNQRDLEEAGWQVIVVWQCETKDLDILAARLKSELG